MVHSLQFQIDVTMDDSELYGIDAFGYVIDEEVSMKLYTLNEIITKNKAAVYLDLNLLSKILRLLVSIVLSLLLDTRSSAWYSTKYTQ